MENKINGDQRTGSLSQWFHYETLSFLFYLISQYLSLLNLLNIYLLLQLILVMAKVFLFSSVLKLIIILFYFFYFFLTHSQKKYCDSQTFVVQFFLDIFHAWFVFVCDYEQNCYLFLLLFFVNFSYFWGFSFLNK